MSLNYIQAAKWPSISILIKIQSKCTFIGLGVLDFGLSGKRIGWEIFCFILHNALHCITFHLIEHIRSKWKWIGHAKNILNISLSNTIYSSSLLKLLLLLLSHGMLSFCTSMWYVFKMNRNKFSRCCTVYVSLLISFRLFESLPLCYLTDTIINLCSYSQWFNHPLFGDVWHVHFLELIGNYTCIIFSSSIWLREEKSKIDRNAKMQFVNLRMVSTRKKKHSSPQSFIYFNFD